MGKIIKNKLQSLQKANKILVKDVNNILWEGKTILDERNSFNNPLHFIYSLLWCIEMGRVNHKASLDFICYFPVLEGEEKDYYPLDLTQLRLLTVKQFVELVANPTELVKQFNMMLIGSKYETKDLELPCEMINKLLASPIYQGGAIKLSNSTLSFSGQPKKTNIYKNYIFKLEDVMRDRYLPVHYRSLEYEGIGEDRKWKRSGY